MIHSELYQEAVMPNNRETFLLWHSIQDVIGRAVLWPVTIRRLFWASSLNHWQRIQLCSFAYVNGLNPEVLFEWLAQRGSVVPNGPRYVHMVTVSSFSIFITHFPFAF